MCERLGLSAAAVIIDTSHIPADTAAAPLRVLSHCETRGCGTWHQSPAADRDHYRNFAVSLRIPELGEESAGLVTE